MGFGQRSGLSADQLWELRLPLGIADGKVDPERRGTLARQSVAVVEARHPSWDQGNSGPTQVLEGVLVDVAGQLDVRRWHPTIARAAHSIGRDVTASPWPGSDERQTLAFQVSINATWVDLAVAYVPSRFMTFRAQPTLRTPTHGAGPAPP